MIDARFRIAPPQLWPHWFVRMALRVFAIWFVTSTVALPTAHASSRLSALRLSASTTWAENISRASAVPTQKSDEYQTLTLATDYFRQLTGNWLLIGTANLEFQRMDTFTALNHGTGTGTLKLRRKFGLGPFAPVFDLSAALAASDFKEDGRSGWQYTLSSSLTKRLTETLSLSARAAVMEYYAHRAVYDTRNRQLTLDGNWDITPRWRFNFGGGRIWEEFVVNAAWPIWGQAIGGVYGSIIKDHYRSLEWDVTDTFGPGWVAYRIRDSHVDLWWAGLSPALTDQTSLDLRYEFARVTNGIGIKYNTSNWTFGLNHHF